MAPVYATIMYGRYDWRWTTDVVALLALAFAGLYMIIGDGAKSFCISNANRKTVPENRDDDEFKLASDSEGENEKAFYKPPKLNIEVADISLKLAANASQASPLVNPRSKGNESPLANSRTRAFSMAETNDKN